MLVLTLDIVLRGVCVLLHASSLPLHTQVTGPHGLHVCMCFEVLGATLLDLIRWCNYRGAPLQIVRSIMSQVLAGLEYMHDEHRIIHTDLKPENVMFTTKLEAIFEGTPLAQSMRYDAAKKTTTPAAAAAAADGGGGGAGGGVSGGGDAAEASRSELTWHDGARSVSADWAEHVESSGRIKCKIVDFGNACWTTKHFTDDIQTRQYRAPEVILGAQYSTPVDVWSAACMSFEVATGDHLFDPQGSKQFSRDDDHIAMVLELIGRKMPRKLTSTGKYARDYFNRHGDLRNIKKLNFWPLDSVLEEKYKYDVECASSFASFLLPMLDLLPERRATAKEALSLAEKMVSRRPPPPAAAEAAPDGAPLPPSGTTLVASFPSGAV